MSQKIIVITMENDQEYYPDQTPDEFFEAMKRITQDTKFIIFPTMMGRKAIPIDKIKSVEEISIELTTQD